jgi:Cof subfamily protein (haloacid dehalogenase superfamily)
LDIKLIAMDMDGTTLCSDHTTISDRTQRALEAAIGRGIVVVPATGRNDALLPGSVMSIPGIRYTITSNGAVTYDMQDQAYIHTGFLDAGLVLDILKEIPKQQVLVEIFRKGKLLVEHDFIKSLREYPVAFLDMGKMKDFFQEVDDLSEFIRNNGDGIEKINFPYVPQQFRQPLWDKFSALPSVALTSSVSHNMEINKADTNKGAALQKLCEHLKIPRDSVMSFGDNGNDIEMLQYAGLSFAMANGTEAAKKAATSVTLTSDEDGVAAAIEKYALGIS